MALLPLMQSSCGSSWGGGGRRLYWCLVLTLVHFSSRNYAEDSVEEDGDPGEEQSAEEYEDEVEEEDYEVAGLKCMFIPLLCWLSQGSYMPLMLMGYSGCRGCCSWLFLAGAG